MTAVNPCALSLPFSARQYHVVVCSFMVVSTAVLSRRVIAFLLPYIGGGIMGRHYYYVFSSSFMVASASVSMCFCSRYLSGQTVLRHVPYHFLFPSPRLLSRLLYSCAVSSYRTSVGRHFYLSSLPRSALVASATVAALLYLRLHVSYRTIFRPSFVHTLLLACPSTCYGLPQWLTVKTPVMFPIVPEVVSELSRRYAARADPLLWWDPTLIRRFA